MIEKRKYKRFKSRLLIATVYRDEMDRIVTEDAIFSEDIGVGGLRMLYPRRLAKGKVLDLKLFLFSDPIHLPAQGKVVWSREKQTLKLTVNSDKDKAKNALFWIGIQFIDIDTFTRERILRWIKREFNVRSAQD